MKLGTQAGYIETVKTLAQMVTEEAAPAVAAEVLRGMAEEIQLLREKLPRDYVVIVRDKRGEVLDCCPGDNGSLLDALYGCFNALGQSGGDWVTRRIDGHEGVIGEVYGLIDDDGRLVVTHERVRADTFDPDTLTFSRYSNC